MDERTTDEELARRVPRDRAAFEPLYDRYLARVYRYVARRSSDRTDAEDVTAAIFLRALERIDTFRGESFAAWLFAIARNAVADSHRGRTCLGIDGVAELVAPGASPEDLAEAAERYAWLRRSLSTLTEEQAEAIELRLAGLSQAEIASVTGRSVAAVKMLQARALRALRSAAHAAEEER